MEKGSSTATTTLSIHVNMHMNNTLMSRSARQRSHMQCVPAVRTAVDILQVHVFKTKNRSPIKDIEG